MRWLFAAISCVVIFLSTNTTANAHVLQQDGDIYGVLHITPDDDPKAGEPTVLLIEFGINRGNFDIKNCDCRLKLIANNKTVQQTTLQPAFSGAQYQSTATVTFPDPAIYQITVTGAAKIKDFTSFSLSYTARVTDKQGKIQASQTTGSNQVILLSVTSLILLSIVAGFMIKEGGRYRQKEVKGHDEKSNK